MMIKFTKMHGIGNDYVYISTFDQTLRDVPALAVRLSDRHTGIGGDGVILVCPSRTADARMEMYNADGSLGLMCGNGVRCVGKFLYDNGIADYASKPVITIETASGVKTLTAYSDGKQVDRLLVDMGRARLEPQAIPAVSSLERIVNEPLTIDGNTYRITCVSMGNPHCVTFVHSVDGIEIEKLGPKFESNPMFPDRVNTEFVQVIDEKTLRMRVWERGSGETLACGTGACAVAVAACLNGICKKGDTVTVQLLGGDLEITYTDDTVMMLGAAQKVFTGEIEV